MESPTIYPMRFPAIPAERRPSSIDDLLPSTYMGQPTPFDQSMKKVGQMLQAKQGDADEASKAALQFGPNVAPGQIAALNAYLFRHNPEAQQYGGVMNQQGTDALQVPGGAPVTPFNTGGQVRAQTDAEQAALAAAKQEAAKAAQGIQLQRLNQQASQFEQRTKDRAAALLQSKVIQDRNDLRMRQLANDKLRFQGQKLQTFNAAQGIHSAAATAFGNANKTQSLISQKEKEMATNYSMGPDEKQKAMDELATLHTQAEAENERGKALSTQAEGLLNGLSGTQPGPAAPKPVSATLFTDAGKNPRFPNAAYGTVNGQPGWYVKDAQGNKTKVE
jgi:hypothetical protein